MSFLWVAFLGCGCGDETPRASDEGGSPPQGGTAGSGGDASAGGEGGQGGVGPTLVCASADGSAYEGEKGSCGGTLIDPACTCNVYGALIEATCPHFINGCKETTCGTIDCGETTVCTSPGVCEVP